MYRGAISDLFNLKKGDCEKWNDTFSRFFLLFLDPSYIFAFLKISSIGSSALYVLFIILPEFWTYPDVHLLRFYTRETNTA